MRALIQRVKKAEVRTKREVAGRINRGFLVLVGIKNGDSEKDIKFLTDKILNLRVFPDSEGKMNLSLLDTKGEILVVSQFTLYGDCQKGRRPSFIEAAPPDIAEKLYGNFVAEIKKAGLKTETGKFGTLMEVKLVNDGPVTLILES